MKYALAFALSMFAFAAAAQTPPIMQHGISYADPTQYTDGSTLPASDIAERRLFCGTNPNQLSMDMLAPAGGKITKEEIIDAFNLGFTTRYYCALRVTAINGFHSANSAVVSFTLQDIRVPKAPTLTVE
jgi:hypothetical protein